MLGWGCAARHLNSADRDAPLTSIEEQSRFRELLTTALEHEALDTLVGGPSLGLLASLKLRLKQLR